MNQTEFFGPGVKDQFPGLEVPDKSARLSFDDNEYYIFHRKDTENNKNKVDFLYQLSDDFIKQIENILNAKGVAKLQ